MLMFSHSLSQSVCLSLLYKCTKKGGQHFFFYKLDMMKSNFDVLPGIIYVALTSVVFLVQLFISDFLHRGLLPLL